MNIQTQQDASQMMIELYQNTFVQRYWGAIGRFMGRGKQASLWTSVAFVMGATLLLGIAVSTLLGETQFTTLKAILANLMWLTYGTLMILVSISINTRMVEFLRQRFVRSLEDEDQIQEFLHWATQWFGNRRAQFFISLIFGIAMALLTFYSIYPATKFSLGQTLIFFLAFFHIGVAIYSFLSLLAFALMLNRLCLILFPDDPASSPILLQLSKHLRDYLLVFSFASAGLLLLDSFTGVLNPNVILLVVSVWTPILALFILGNQAFSLQIMRVKHERMEQLQFEIRQISDVNQPDKDTLAHITSLLNFHDRVKATRNSLDLLQKSV